MIVNRRNQVQVGPLLHGIAAQPQTHRAHLLQLAFSALAPWAAAIPSRLEESTPDLQQKCPFLVNEVRPSRSMPVRA